MSTEPVTCENCKAVGQRPLTHHAPVGWLYMETVVELPAPLLRQKVITYACSPRCTEIWHPGPGPQLPGVGLTVAAAIARREKIARGELPLDDGEQRRKAIEEIANDPRGGVAARLEAVEARLAWLAARASNADRRCAFDEGSCKAADCPQHGWSRSGRGDG
jgi:hypothetical protein